MENDPRHVGQNAQPLVALQPKWKTSTSMDSVLKSPTDHLISGSCAVTPGAEEFVASTAKPSTVNKTLKKPSTAGP